MKKPASIQSAASITSFGKPRAWMPAVEAYKELVDEDLREDIEEIGTLKVGEVYGKLSWPMPYPTDLTKTDMC